MAPERRQAREANFFIIERSMADDGVACWRWALYRGSREVIGRSVDFAHREDAIAAAEWARGAVAECEIRIENPGDFLKP
jgi:hypothetical protein